MKFPKERVTLIITALPATPFQEKLIKDSLEALGIAMTTSYEKYHKENKTQWRLTVGGKDPLA